MRSARHKRGCPWKRRLGLAAGAGLVALAISPCSAAGDESRRPVDASWTREQVALAVAYEHGEGVPKDQLKAAALYCEAARAGDPEAQYGLAWMYANGRGVARDDELAASLFALAAGAGHQPAQRALIFAGTLGGRLPDCMTVEERPAVEHVGEEGPNPFAGLSADKQRIVDLVRQLAPRYAVDPRLALAVIAVESDFEPRARSMKDAQGLMQLIPDTAARFNVRNPFDPQENIKGGLAYLRWLLSYYRGQVTFAVAAYNAGERMVDKHRGIPPFPETRDYVRKIRGLFRSEHHPFDPRIVDASPALAPVKAAQK